MLSNQNKLTIIDEEGNEIEMEILLTFEHPETKKQYVLFKDPHASEENVFAYEYDEEGNLNDIDNPDVFEMCEEILSAYEDEDSLNGKK